MGFSGFILCSLIVTIVYFFGILIFLNDYEENKCEMTYMYEYPQFVHIKLDVHSKFQKYGLYAYSEGRFTYNARNMKFSGIPILFIPGNAGSYRQVRSFASVSLRKSLDDRHGFHFDFFTVNLNDEFSGLNGALLDEQTEYVNYSVYKILELYGSNSKVQTKKIILLGHSMGGIIARGILTLFKDNIVPLIITLATPHSRPLLTLDSYMYNYYNRLKTADNTVNSTIISLSGGYNDYLITPFITNAKHFDNVHIFSPSVPLVWLPIDHLCILWCKQLVLVVTRGLFDAVDHNTKQISQDPQYLHAVFRHHLVKNNGIKIRKSLQSIQSTQSATFMKGRGRWIENLQKQYTISLPNGVQEMQYHMIRILDDADYRYLTILALNLEVVEWVYACSAIEVQGQNRICSEGIHLSHLTQIVPSVRYKRKMLKFDTLELKKNYTEITHMIVRLLPTSKPVKIHVDRYFEHDRKLENHLTPLLSFQWNLIVNETQEKAVYYEIMFPQLTHIIQSYKLDVQPIKCNGQQHHATASLIVPWGNQNAHKHFTEVDHSSFVVRLHSTRSANSGNGSATILLTLDPICKYSVSIQYNILGSIGQITRIYTPLLLPNMVAVILLAFRNQMFGIEATKSCSLFFSAAQYGIKPYYLLPMVKIASRVLSWKGFSNFWIMPDWHVITEDGNDFFLLPLVLYMTSVGLVWLSGLILALSLILYEATFHKLACKFLARAVTGSQRLSDWVLSALRKLPGVVAIMLVVLSITTCGGLSLCLGCVFYFFKLIQMSQDYIERLVLRMLKYFVSKVRRNFSSDTSDSQSNQKNVENCVLKELEEESSQTEEDDDKRCVENQIEEVEKAVTEMATEDNTNKTVSEDTQQSDCNGIFFHFSIFMLWCIVAGLSVPSVLTWAHNFKYNTVLQPDPSFVPGLVLSLCALPLWHMDLPKINICGYSYIGQILTILATITLIYASVYLYRLNYIIIVTIVVITCHQVFTLKEANSNDSNIGDNVTTETGSEPIINNAKSKLE